MSKITKQDFDKLYDENISKKEYDRIIKLIDARFVSIVEKMIPNIPNQAWFCYGNCSNRDRTNGFFDPQLYRENIYIGGHINVPDPFESFGIPARWLWEDFEDEMKLAIQKAKLEETKRNLQAEADKREREIKKIEMHSQIKSKLSEEELKYVQLVNRHDY